MTTIFTQVNGYSFGSGHLSYRGSSHRIRFNTATRLAHGSDMINI